MRHIWDINFTLQIPNPTLKFSAGYVILCCSIFQFRADFLQLRNFLARIFAVNATGDPSSGALEDKLSKQADKELSTVLTDKVSHT
jgi:hypothetical protein